MKHYFRSIGAGCCLGVLMLSLANCQSGSPNSEVAYDSARARMVRDQIESRGIKSASVLDAMKKVPRHEFVPENMKTFAYNDRALPIEHKQTISQPYIVALMTELLDPEPGQKIFEVGTGSGYQAAVLAEIGATVYTIDIVKPLADNARETLKRLQYSEKVSVRAGDGFEGWPEAAPFDGIIITCAVPIVPPPLIKQLKPGGKMVLPLGNTLHYQDLTVVTKDKDGKLHYKNVLDVIFVPLLGPHGYK